MKGMHRTPTTKLWMKKTYNPYFDMIKDGIVWFDERVTQDDFTPKAGDWVVFQLWSENPREFLKKQEVKAVNLVRNTAEVFFWKVLHSQLATIRGLVDIEEFGGFTIMALKPPLCPRCGHVVRLEYDEDVGADGRVFDVSYFGCDISNLPTVVACLCDCNEHIDDLKYCNQDIPTVWKLPTVEDIMKINADIVAQLCGLCKNMGHTGKEASCNDVTCPCDCNPTYDKYVAMGHNMRPAGVLEGKGEIQCYYCGASNLYQPSPDTYRCAKNPEDERDTELLYLKSDEDYDYYTLKVKK